MAKKITGYIKLQVPAGSANPSPPIGPALGQRGLNIMEFCKAFNARTAQLEKGSPIPVVITAYQDRSFTFEMRQPPVTFFLKKAAGLKIGKKPASGAQTPDRGGDEDDPRLRPFDGPRGGGVNHESRRQANPQGARERRPHQALSARRS